jgi:hypothetical protein
MVISSQYDADTEIKRAITPEEQRCQTYLALIHGAKGLFYFKYPIEHKDTWECFAGTASVNGLTSELKALSPCILTPDIDQKITYSEWDYSSSEYESVSFAPLSGLYPAVQVSLREAPSGAAYDYVLLATNTNAYSVDVDYSVSLLSNDDIIYRRAFDSNNAWTRTYSSSKFSDTLDAYATRAYTFDSTSTDPITISVAVTPPQTIPDAETSYPSTGRPSKTNIFRNPTLETDSWTLSNWPDYCWPYNVDQDNRIGSANQSWGLISTPDSSGLEDAIGDGDDPGSTCLKIAYPGMVFSYVDLPLVSEQTYTISAYIKKTGEGSQSVLINTGMTGWNTTHSLSETWTRYWYTFPYSDRKITFKPTVEGGPDILIDAVQIEITTAGSPVDFTVD